MKLQCKLPGQNFMKMNRKISQGILYGQFLFFGREYILSFWSMIQALVIRFRIGQLSGIPSDIIRLRSVVVMAINMDDGGKVKK